MTNDLLGDLFGDSMLCDRDANGLLVLLVRIGDRSRRFHREDIGDVGPDRGSGDVSRLVWDIFALYFGLFVDLYSLYSSYRNAPALFTVDGVCFDPSVVHDIKSSITSTSLGFLRSILVH